MLKIAVIGIGNIAQKAYLPVFSAMRNQVEWYLVTGNKETLDSVGSQYGFKKRYQTLDELGDIHLDAAFIHNATVAHYETVKRLLNKGVPVYVDKPISDQFSQTEELLALAEENHVQLTAGFNRRFAPMIQQLKAIPDKKMILIQKDRVENHESIRFAIYDLFIHIVDLALFLLDEPVVSFQSHIHETEGELKRVWLVLETIQTTAIVTMNYQAGANQEVVEIQSLAGVQRVTDLNEMVIKEKNHTESVKYSDWEETLVKRGFKPIIHAFIESLLTGQNPVSHTSSLQSHKICEEIINPLK